MASGSFQKTLAAPAPQDLGVQGNLYLPLLKEGSYWSWGKLDFGAVSERRKMALGVSLFITVNSQVKQPFCTTDTYITMYGFNLRLDEKESVNWKIVLMTSLTM